MDNAEDVIRLKEWSSLSSPLYYKLDYEVYTAYVQYILKVLSATKTVISLSSTRTDVESSEAEFSSDTVWNNVADSHPAIRLGKVLKVCLGDKVVLLIVLMDFSVTNSLIYVEKWSIAHSLQS